MILSKPHTCTSNGYIKWAIKMAKNKRAPLLCDARVMLWIPQPTTMHMSAVRLFIACDWFNSCLPGQRYKGVRQRWRSLAATLKWQQVAEWRPSVLLIKQMKNFIHQIMCQISRWKIRHLVTRLINGGIDCIWLHCLWLSMHRDDWKCYWVIWQCFYKWK